MSTNSSHLNQDHTIEDIFSFHPPTADDGAVPYRAVPGVLKALPNWVAWRTVVRDGKPTKVPFDVKTGHPAKANDPETWTTFEQALEATDVFGDGKYDGLGLQLGTTNLVGIDFDSSINTKGVIDPYVLSILQILGSPYTEKSPSGTGLHAFVECDVLPAGGRKMSAGHVGIEIYHGKEGGRYFTITGEKVLGDGVPFIDDMALPYMLISKNKDKKFKRLWLGDTSDFDGDESTADFHLLLYFAEYTHNDPAAMEKFFGLSALAQREKWKRDDYRQRTINAAIAANGKESGASVVEEYEALSTCVSLYPQMGDDLISQYARQLVTGTGIPFGHARECLKNFLAFCLSDATHYPGHKKLYLRGWHFNLGEPETGKTTALTEIIDRWSSVLIDLGIWVDKLSSYGSLQYLTKGFEDHERMLLYVTEGNTLANSNEHIPAIFAGLSDLYDQPVISAGSYRNKSAKCVKAKGSCIVCVTPDDFIKAMQGKGVIGGGVLPRWTMSYSEKVSVEGDWAAPNEQVLRILQERIKDRFTGVNVVETEDAKVARLALTKEMERSEIGRHGKRLIEHYKRECLLSAVFAGGGTVGEITKEIAEWAALWTRYQQRLRITYWPIDAGNDVERMCSAMRALLKRANPKGVSLKQLKDAANVYREGSGGIDVFGRAYRAMMQNEEMRKVGVNARGKDLFGLVIE